MFKLMIYLIKPLNKKELINENELVHITYRYRRYGVESTLQRLMSTYVRTLYTSQVLFRCNFKHGIIHSNELKTPRHIAIPKIQL